MKKMKKIAAFAAATVMAVSMASISAFATGNAADDASEGTYSVIKITSDHTYTYWKILDGTFQDGVIVNATVPEGVDADALQTALSATANDGVTLAEKMAKTSGTELANLIKTNSTSIFGAESTGTALANGDKLTTGYYYIEENAGNSQTAYILAIVDGTNEITIRTKLGAPIVEKKVQDNETDETTATKSAIDDSAYSDSTAANKFNDTADYSIGVDVPFEILGTIPDNIDEFEHYYYQFTDTLGKGFTAPADTQITVTINGQAVSPAVAVSTDDSTGVSTITVTFEDIKMSNVKAGDIIKIAYTAKLNSNAVIGELGNTNGVYATYSNDTSYNGTLADKEGKTTTTTEDGVGVFTYEIDSTKVDAADGSALANATFKFLNSDKSKAAVIADGKFVEWVDFDSEDATTFTTTASGEFKIAGIDEGVYYILETVAPSGYNKLTDPIKVELLATTDKDSTYTYTADNASSAFTSLNAKIDDELVTDDKDAETAVNYTNGKVSVTIENSKGSTLPETGGIGTKIFFTAGGIMVAGAGITLVTKKRMKKEEV